MTDPAPTERSDAVVSAEDRIEKIEKMITDRMFIWPVREIRWMLPYARLGATVERNKEVLWGMEHHPVCQMLADEAERMDADG